MSVAFLANQLVGATINVAVAFGADPAGDPALWSWTDVTTRVRFADKVIITIGRTDRTSTAPPASCLLTFDNRDGYFTAYEPLGVNWPNLVPNLPLRVQVTVSATTSTRFLGHIVGFPPSTDVTGHEAVVRIEARGAKRRLSTGNTPLRSPLYRAIIADTTSKLAYWPVEDSGGNATQVAAGVLGDQPMTVGGVVNFGEYTGLTGSAPMATLTATSALFGTVPRATAATNWQVDWHYFMPAAPGVDTVLMQVNTTGSIVKWQLVMASDGLTYAIKGFNAAGAATVNDVIGNTSSPNLLNTLIHFSLFAKQSGGNLVYTWRASQSLGGSSIAPGDTTIVGTAGTPTGWWVPASAGLNGTSMGHFVVYDAYNYTQAGLPAFGYTAEAVLTRLNRLTLEQGEQFASTGFYIASTKLGPQDLDTFVNLCEEAAFSSDSYLYDGLGAGLQWQSPSQRPDQSPSFTIDAAQRQLMPTIQAADDDLRRINIMVVQNKHGSSATFEQTGGQLGSNKIGPTDSSITVNHTDDRELYSRSVWEVHFGIVEGLRFPVIPLNLVKVPTLATSWIGITPGRGIVVKPPFQQTLYPTGDLSLIVEGWQERLTTKEWSADLNCTNAESYRCYATNSTTLGRTCADLGQGSTLASGVSAGATSLSVATPAGQPLFQTGSSSPDFPAIVGIDGIPVTVTAISGTSSPQTFTVTGATVTKTLSANKVVEAYKPGVLRYS